MLDGKLGELSKMGYDQLPALLQKIRQMTAGKVQRYLAENNFTEYVGFSSEEMEQFHKETEANLNRTVATLKQQMSEDEKEKKRVELDKMAAQSVAHSLDASNRDLQAQVRARLFHKYPYLRNFSPKNLSCKYFSGAKFEATDTVTAAGGGPGENEL